MTFINEIKILKGKYKLVVKNQPRRWKTATRQKIQNGTELLLRSLCLCHFIPLTPSSCSSFSSSPHPYFFHRAVSLCRPSLVPCLQQSNSQCHAPVRHEGESLVPLYPTTLPYLYPLLCRGSILPDFLCRPDHIPSPVGRRYPCQSHPASYLSLCQRSPAPCLGRTQHGHHSL